MHYPEGGCLISVRDYESIERGGQRMNPRTVHERFFQPLVLGMKD